MRQDYTDIVFVLDRSGSMQIIWDDVVGGFKTFINDQKKQPGKCTFTLFVFDDVYDKVISGQSIDSVEGIPDHVKPRNMTALLDSMGKAIIDTGNRLRALSETERPAKVVFVVQTDGQENSSREFNMSKIAEMVREQTDKYNWQFVFLGANMDSIKEAASVGIVACNSLNWAQNQTSVKSLYDGLSNKTSSYRSGTSSSMGFTDSEKQEIEKF